MKCTNKFNRSNLSIIIVFSFLILLSVSCNNQQTENTNIESKDSVAVEVNTKVKHPKWSSNKNIYEVNIRQYTEEGTFNAFAEHLPRLKQMGVDILWLMPVQPIGEKNRKGLLGSCYSTKDYMTTNPDYGTMEDFKNLVKKAHELEMYILIDWVANHTAWDNQMAANNPEWYTKDSVGNFTPPTNTDWSDVIDLNYDNAEMRKYMIDALKFWVTESDIDGFRCDMAMMVPTDFWNTARAELDKIKPVFMIAEAEVPELLEKAFDVSYTWTYFHITEDIYKGEKNASHLRNHLDSITKAFPENSIFMNFTSNHDENSWNGTDIELFGDALETFKVMAATIPGTPLIYSGQEAGLNKRLKFFEKDPIDWTNTKNTELYAKLLKFKKDNKALWHGDNAGDYINIKTSDDNAVFGFMRKKDDNEVLVILNLTDKPQNITLKSDLAKGTYTDLFTEKTMNLAGNDNFELKAWDFKICYK